MYSVAASIDIDAVPETVFDTLSNLTGWPDMIEDIVSIELLTDGPVGVGTTFRETRMLFGKEAAEKMTFETFERPESYRLTARSGGSHYLTTTSFEPIPSGTRMQIHFRARPEKMVAWLLLPIALAMQGMLRKCLEKDLACIKASIEGRSTSDPV